MSEANTRHVKKYTDVNILKLNIDIIKSIIKYKYSLLC